MTTVKDAKAVITRIDNNIQALQVLSKSGKEDFYFEIYKSVIGQLTDYKNLLLDKIDSAIL